MTKIAVFLAEGFEEIEATNIIDVLRRAELETIIVSVTGKLDITGSHDITITADQLFNEFDFTEIDMLVLPGGMPGANNLNNHIELKKLITGFHQQEKLIGAICAAPIVLGGLGILKGRDATCYPGFEHQLNGANYTGNNVEISENIVTGKGAGVAIIFALKIVEQFRGENFANELARKMIVN